MLFAGCTVIISLLGLFIVNLPFMQGLAVGAIAAVVLVMAAALTLLPAMLGFAGQAIDRLHVPGPAAVRRPSPHDEASGTAGAGMIQRHRWSSALRALLVLVVLAIPLFSMRLAFTDAGNDPTSLTTRQAYDLLAEGFGPGFNGPLVIAAPAPAQPAGQASMDRLDATIRATPGVAFAVPAQVNAAGNTGGDHRLPDRLAPGGGDGTTGHPSPERRHPAGHGRNRCHGPCRRGDGCAASTPRITCQPGSSGSSVVSSCWPSCC